MTFFVQLYGNVKTIMKCINFSLFVIMVFLFGCSGEVKIDNVKEIKVFKTKIQVDPSKRNLKYIGNLDGSGKAYFQDYVKKSQRVSYAYVVSEYYLEIISYKNEVRRVGVVVIKDNSDELELDITTSDPEKLYATSFHDLLVCSDKNIAQKLRKSILATDKSR